MFLTSLETAQSSSLTLVLNWHYEVPVLLMPMFVSLMTVHKDLLRYFKTRTTVPLSSPPSSQAGTLLLPGYEASKEREWRLQHAFSERTATALVGHARQAAPAVNAMVRFTDSDD